MCLVQDLYYAYDTTTHQLRHMLTFSSCGHHCTSLSHWRCNQQNCPTREPRRFIDPRVKCDACKLFESTQGIKEPEDEPVDWTVWRVTHIPQPDAPVHRADGLVDWIRKAKAEEEAMERDDAIVRGVEGLEIGESIGEDLKRIFEWLRVAQAKET